MLAMWDVNLKIMWKEKKKPKQRGSAWNARFLTWNGYFLTWFQRGSPHQEIKVQFGEIWRVENVLGPQVKCCTMDRHSLQPMSIFSLASMERQNHGKSIIWNIKRFLAQTSSLCGLVWAGCGVPKPKGEGLWTQWQLPLLLQRCDRRKPKRWPVPALPRPRHRSLGPAGASHEARAVAGIFSWFSYWSSLANIHLRWATICHIHRNENPIRPSINGGKMLSIFVMKKWSQFLQWERHVIGVYLARIRQKVSTCFLCKPICVYSHAWRTTAWWLKDAGLNKHQAHFMQLMSHPFPLCSLGWNNLAWVQDLPLVLGPLTQPRTARCLWERMGNKVMWKGHRQTRSRRTRDHHQRQVVVQKQIQLLQPLETEVQRVNPHIRQKYQNWPGEGCSGRLTRNRRSTTQQRTKDSHQKMLTNPAEKHPRFLCLLLPRARRHRPSPRRPLRHRVHRPARVWRKVVLLRMLVINLMTVMVLQHLQVLNRPLKAPRLWRQRTIREVLCLMPSTEPGQQNSLLIRTQTHEQRRRRRNMRTVTKKPTIARCVFTGVWTVQPSVFSQLLKTWYRQFFVGRRFMQACVRVCHINVCAYVFPILCVYMWWGNTKHAVPGLQKLKQHRS